MKYLAALFISFCVFLSSKNPAQENSYERARILNSINLHSPENILKFADHLFHQKDYLRAIKEYNKVRFTNNNDTLAFKIAYAFSQMKRFEEAQKYYLSLLMTSKLSDFAIYEIYKNKFYSEEYSYINNNLPNEINNIYRSDENLKRLYLLSTLIDKNYESINFEMLKYFPEEDQKDLKQFYERKTSPGYKSPLKSALLSTLIPGLGKIYTKNYGDGVTALLLTGVLSYVSYDNFKADHDFRGWFWGSFAALFYAGNIYGSAASAQIYNAKVDLSFSTDLKLFINKKNYLPQKYDFIK